MNSRERLFFNRRVVVTLLIAAIAAFCLAPPANTQDSWVIPGAVDGLTVHPGDIISLGYEVAITDINPVPITIAVTNPTMLLSVRCPNGSSETITINAPVQSFLVPANVNSWFPLDTIYEGATTVPSTLCGGQGGVETGVTFLGNCTKTCKTTNSTQGCCHTECNRMRHKHHEKESGAEHESEWRESCKPEKECESPQNG